MNTQGKVFKYPDNVDTDVIIPARYLNTADAAELAKHCMEDIDTGFVDQVRPGDIMVAGWNFGCGSSREHARPWSSRPAAPAVSLPNPSPGFSTATPSTSACPFWSARPRRRRFRRGTGWISILTRGSSPTAPPERPIRRSPSRSLSRTSSEGAACLLP